MPFSIIKQHSTNTASTADWLTASKDMTISAYDPVFVKATPVVQPPIGNDAEGEAEAEPLFGAHVRETVSTVKEWLGRK